MSIINSVDQLQAIYGKPGKTALVKELDHLIPEYEAFIAASPFVGLATSGPGGLDCSPRGDIAGFVQVRDSRTLLVPDRIGNNRVDSLSNIVQDGRAGLLFLVPGSGTTLRVNGRAEVSTEKSLCMRFVVDGKLPRSVIVLHIQAVYFQCSRAIVRSDIWNGEKHVDAASLPTPGQILSRISAGEVGGDTYDKEWPERAKASLW